MTIHWSKPLLEKLLPLDLWERIQEAQTDPSFDAKAAIDYVIPFYDAKTGNHIKNAPMPHAIRVSRKKMRKFVSQGIDVQYGKDLVAYQYDEVEGVVTATFADGSTAAGSTLVGADGHRSNVRDLLLGPKGALLPILGGVQLVGLTVCYNDAEKAAFV